MRGHLFWIFGALLVFFSADVAMSTPTLRPGPRTTYALAAIIDVCIRTHPELTDAGLRAYANSVAPYVDAARDYVQRHPEPNYDAAFKLPNLGISQAELDNICPKIARTGWPMRRQGIINWQFRHGYVENIW
jgi:hypothetical protein